MRRCLALRATIHLMVDNKLLEAALLDEDDDGGNDVVCGSDLPLTARCCTPTTGCRADCALCFCLAIIKGCFGSMLHAAFAGMPSTGILLLSNVVLQYFTGVSCCSK